MKLILDIVKNLVIATFIILALVFIGIFPIIDQVYKGIKPFINPVIAITIVIPLIKIVFLYHSSLVQYITTLGGLI